MTSFIFFSKEDCISLDKCYLFLGEGALMVQNPQYHYSEQLFIENRYSGKNITILRRQTSVKSQLHHLFTI